MTTSNYMPDVTVEIAFGDGFSTPAASRTWTDVSDFVEFGEGITITVGRQNETSQADPNQLSLVLDNSDGRFTPGKTGGAYYPDVKLGVPIRVRADPVDGALQDEFTGYVNEWPVSWPSATDGHAVVSITASSRMSRLGGQAGLKSIVETAILADSPSAYYTLGEPAGSTQANNSAGTSRVGPLTLAGDLSLPVVFGNAIGPGTDGLTAIEFQGSSPAPQTVIGQYLAQGGLLALSPVGWTVECFFSTTAQFGSLIQINQAGTSGGAALTLSLGISSGILVAGPVTGLSAASNVADGSTHHAAATWDGTTLKLYLDGALADSDASSGTVSASPSALLVGWGYTGVVAHAAVYASVLSAGAIASHANAGLTGYAGETTSARLIRYAGFAGIDSSEVDAETGSVTVAHVDTTDKSALQLMRVMEDTEGGVLFDHRDGSLVFHNRAHRYNRASSYTLDMAQQMVESDYQPRLDRTVIANDASAQNLSGTVSAHQVDQASWDDHGQATWSIETAAEDDDEPLNQVGWALLKYAQPKVRVPTLTVDTLAQVGKTPNCAAIMATNVGDKITVSNRPSQDTSSSETFFVEGYTRVYGQESVRTTFNVSPTSPEDQTLIIGDPVRGFIGTNPIAF